MVDPGLIAKNNLSIKEPAVKIASKGGSFLTVIGFLFLLVVGGIAGGVQYYKGSVETELSDRTEQLSQLEENLDPELIKEIVRADQGLLVAREILGAHVYPSNIFKLIEDATIETVAFKRFLFAQDTGTITMDGDVRGYPDLERQIQEFQNVPTIKKVSFSNLTLSTEGLVGFTMQLVFDSQILRYKAN